MKVNYQWLTELVTISIPPKELAELLTMAGLEAGVVDQTRLDLPGIIVGLIKSVVPHPHAGQLLICQVDNGEGIVPIICGAPNATPGAKVPLALEGAMLPGNRLIKRKSIKGIDSYGMICSEYELGVGTDAANIWILPEDTLIGQEITSFLDKEATTIELNLTPNRGDCLCMLGVAREVAALTGQKVRLPLIQVREEGDSVEKFSSVEILEPELCPRYGARIIYDINLKPSPLWMQRRLELAGVRPINNIVDITNYVMLELGQPLHAFDYDLLEEGRIIVRLANQGEVLTTLDGVNRHLGSDNLVIADARRSIALAGIMGGNGTEIHSGTKRILLESATFNPLTIRKTAKSLGMMTEASRRFERGCDPDGVVRALDRAVHLMEATNEGIVAKGVIDKYPKPIFPVKINLRGQRANAILGTQIKVDKMKGCLEALELKVIEKDEPDEVIVEVPLFRPDLNREIDLIEEIARLYGYDLIPSTLPHAQMVSADSTRGFLNQKKVKDLMLSCGVDETINLSFISGNSFDQLRLPPDDETRHAVELKNPLSGEWAVMRTTLIPSLLKTIQLNRSRGKKDIRIFEIGRVYHPQKETVLPSERLYLAVALCGLRTKDIWHPPNEYCDFYDLKGIMDTLLERLNLSSAKWLRQPLAIFWKKESYILSLNGQELGTLGNVHPDILNNFEINAPVFFFEIDLDLVFQLSQSEIRYQPLAKYPAVYRDLSVIVPRNIQAGSVEQIIKGEGTEILKDVSLFDVYEGQPVEAGKKSLAFSLVYQSEARTLTDQEVDGIHTRIIDALTREFGATLRN